MCHGTLCVTSLRCHQGPQEARGDLKRLGAPPGLRVSEPTIPPGETALAQGTVPFDPNGNRREAEERFPGIGAVGLGITQLTDGVPCRLSSRRIAPMLRPDFSVQSLWPVSCQPCRDFVTLSPCKYKGRRADLTL